MRMEKVGNLAMQKMRQEWNQSTKLGSTKAETSKTSINIVSRPAAVVCPELLFETQRT